MYKLYKNYRLKKESKESQIKYTNSRQCIETLKYKGSQMGYKVTKCSTASNSKYLEKR